MRSQQKKRGPFERDLRGVEYLDLLSRLQGKTPFFQQFRDWDEVLDFMWVGSSRDPLKDQVLLPILTGHYRERDPRWQYILLAIFRPGLLSLKRRKSHWDQDRDELWQNILITFLQVVDRLDVETRSCRLVQKIFNGTVHRLHDWYVKHWAQTNRESLLPPDEVDILIAGMDDISLALVDSRDEVKSQISKARRLHAAGCIDRKECQLLIDHWTTEKTLKDVAMELGLDYEVARKRRQRAEVKLAEWEEKGKKSKKMSPGSGNTPLSPLEEPRRKEPTMARARTTDPDTSHVAAQEVEASGRAKTQRLAFLAQVRKCPGMTAAEIAVATGKERHVPSRRLPELRDDYLVSNREIRRCKVTGRLSLTWYPGKGGQA